jgi:hypothetical protein
LEDQNSTVVIERLGHSRPTAAMGPAAQRNLLQGSTDQSQGIPVIKSPGVGLGSPTVPLPPSIEQLTILLLHESLQTSAEEFVVFLDDIKEAGDLRQSMTELLEFTENRVFTARQGRLFALFDVALVVVQFLLHHGVRISVQSHKLTARYVHLSLTFN